MHETESTKHPIRRLWIIPPIAIGVFALMMLSGNKLVPTQVENREMVHAVRTITIPRVDLQPVAKGYGVVQPAKVWSAVAQVSGRVVEMHSRLRNGEIIPAGTLLFRIDPTDSMLALEQLKAELTELEVRQQNTKDLLKIEQRNLVLAEREATRLKELAQKGSTSQSSADSAERAMLSSRTAVQNLRNTLALIPTQSRVIQAKLARSQRDLENTRIQAPFNLRIANLNIETEQYVTIGQKLFEGDGVDRSEVVAQVAMSSMRHLFINHGTAPPNTTQLTEGLVEYTDLHPFIQMDLGEHQVEWEAEFVRFTDNIDTETRTIGVVVAIDNPLDKIIPGQRPPLSKGMFVKVVLNGRIQPQQIIIPRSVVREGKVLLVNPQQALEIRDVEVRYSQDEISVIQSGVEAGQQLVVSDLISAIAGMRLQSHPDLQLEQQLLHSAAGAQQ
ncbi:MAG: efflux RND transporter periplasmic adaptor subunit [Gammaproteobacteria bacterium]|jgi:RND family efflux transporter MFP subunit|nr:efflux RND transporter periplasmic adaptor subunit [Gammaproteobacteria bacterium]MBT7309063.1 efflux RND transporter periplasmic adaptor subunit [Gammaproteobacteria bacterium]